MFLALIFIAYFSVSGLPAAEVIVPLPLDAIKVSEKGPFGLDSSVYQRYNSSLNKDKLAAFYKLEMLKRGWKEFDEGAFVKDSQMIVFSVDSEADGAGKTGFMILISRMLKAEDMAALRKKNPDKLNFMPIYPGSEQVYLYDLAHGAVGKYETSSGVKEVAFFYKSGMLN